MSTPENLGETLERVERLKPLMPPGISLPELALRFILGEQTVSTVIPGMRKMTHVERNLRVSDGGLLENRLLQALRGHRWNRHANIE